VGAGVSTVLLLGALHLTRAREEPSRFSTFLPLVVAAGTGLMLVWGTWGLPPFGLAETPMNTGPGVEYLGRAYEEMHVPNVVTAVLASYRGYDTLGEVVVVFIAAIAVLMLLKRPARGED